jgi:hypothetical protein
MAVERSLEVGIFSYVDVVDLRLGLLSWSERLNKLLEYSHLVGLLYLLDFNNCAKAIPFLQKQR